ncbi:uncharacterized protein LOC130448085 isoform X1 [Diorhabda sublineata]|uniref:uncharacterized protein LOC130448085 isoform X1 n=1 Tax=Diorhabda sublineata TaxID=1163346 RepID=UPI0024E12AD7|nr:uncharacterized protein LOC130448085 isoform X1 [Diorhabda sublineata]
MLQYQNNNDTINTVVQKNVLNFCTILSSHCNNWNSLLTEAIKPVQALVNFSEQLRHVEKANIKYIDDFEDLQQKLLYKITSEIEDEIQLIKDILSRLSAANQLVKNRLSILEKSTIDLDWEEITDLIKGNAFQPPLYRILQDGYEFMMFFTNALKSMNESFKILNVRNEKIMNDFENKFKLDLESNLVVNNFLAIVQYVGNEKSVI